MLFNKYQYVQEDILQRGYSKHSVAQDEQGQKVWIKWILGIAKESPAARVLNDRLRHLKKARVAHTPAVLEYGYDAEQATFAIVFENLEAVETLPQAIQRLETREVYEGLLQVVETLEEMQMGYQIAHGDVQPENILVDRTGKFWVVDFGIADLTKTLSQQADLVIFAAKFAAPEKLGKQKSSGFPFQADLYSMGRVLQWYWEECGITSPEAANKVVSKLLSDDPAKRGNHGAIEACLRDLSGMEEPLYAQVETTGQHAKELLQAMNEDCPRFWVGKDEGSNVVVSFVAGQWVATRALWLLEGNRLKVLELKHREEDADSHGKISRLGKVVPFRTTWLGYANGQKVPEKLSPIFLAWRTELREKSSQRRQRGSIEESLAFYKELLETEIAVIRKKAITFQYEDFTQREGNAVFKVVMPDDASPISAIHWHIEQWNTFESDGVDYEIGATAVRRQSKDKVRFSGYPFEFNATTGELMIRDCQKLVVGNIPPRGYLIESTSRQEEEKRRQLDAIQTAERGEAQNPHLIHALMVPESLKSRYLELNMPLEKVYQKDNYGLLLKYSPNQLRSINLAVRQSPVCLIQGPPGTGKTTVITEIVFQLLAQQPNAKILITSQTNPAVDQVLENLIAQDIPVMRLNGMREPDSVVVKAHTMERKMDGWKQETLARAKKNQQKVLKARVEALKEINIEAGLAAEVFIKFPIWKFAKGNLEAVCRQYEGLHAALPLPDDREGAIRKIEDVTADSLDSVLCLLEIQEDWKSAVSSLDEKSPLRLRLVDSIRVVGSTCNHIAAKKYRDYNFEFDYVIMDESGKATVAESLVPAVLGERLILVGDHRQLRPTLTRTKDVEKWLRTKYKKEAQELESWDDYFNRPSLFETVITQVEPEFKAQLTDCRRSARLQVDLTSKCFYEAEGDDPIIPVTRPLEKEHCLALSLDTSVLMVDIGSNHPHQKDENGSSANAYSAKVVIPELLGLLDRFPIVKDYDIGIITGYSAQKRQIEEGVRNAIAKKALKHLRHRTFKALSIAVVDRFQGLERDIVIVDLVKAGPNLDLGFLAVPNRINVALSRQKRLLIVIGDYISLVNAPNAKGREGKAALQHYLELIPRHCIISFSQLNTLLP